MLRRSYTTFSPVVKVVENVHRNKFDELKKEKKESEDYYTVSFTHLIGQVCLDREVYVGAISHARRIGRHDIANSFTSLIERHYPQ